MSSPIASCNHGVMSWRLTGLPKGRDDPLSWPLTTRCRMRSYAISLHDASHSGGSCGSRPHIDILDNQTRTLHCKLPSIFRGVSVPPSDSAERLSQVPSHSPLRGRWRRDGRRVMAVMGVAGIESQDPPRFFRTLPTSLLRQGHGGRMTSLWLETQT